MTTLKLFPGKLNGERFLYIIVRSLYILGLGSYWYEKDERKKSKLHDFCYFLLCFVNISCSFVLVASEVLAVFKPEISDEDWRDAVNFSIAHVMICLKWVVLINKKNAVQELLKGLMDLKKYHTDPCIDKRELIYMKIYTSFIASGTLSVLTALAVESTVKSLKYGEVYDALKTYWPDSAEVSTEAFFARIFFNVTWWIFGIGMIFIDSLVASTLIMLAHRFRLVQSYFSSIKLEFDESYMRYGQPDMENCIRTAFIKGIRLHNETLICAKKAQNICSLIFSCQMFEAAGMLTVLLLQVASAERTLANLFAKFTFLLTMAMLLGAFMWTCGEVSYEASRVSDAIYDSGWQRLLHRNADMRRLVVISTQRANIPVEFRAFGLINMSYNSFILVVKSSYSAFAVLC